MKRIGFIGLGIMGRPMTKNLMKAGYSLVVHDINAAPVEELMSLGAEQGVSPADVAQKCSHLITMLPNSPEVKTVILGSEGVIEGAARGSVVIDMSSISPLVSREVGEALNKKKVKFLDAPVSGGEPGAINATLSIMVGGDPEVFWPIQPPARMIMPITPYPVPCAPSPRPSTYR